MWGVTQRYTFVERCQKGNLMNDTEKTCLIVRDELAVNMKYDTATLDIIIENLKIRLEKDLTIPEKDKIINEGDFDKSH